jgi:UrcA family protein
MVRKTASTERPTTIQEPTMNTKTQTTRLPRVAVAVLFSTFALSLAAMSHADSTGASQEKVKYAGLDLSRSTGAGALYARISIAANEVCRELDHGDLSSKLIFNRCVHQAIANAVAAVDQPALYSVYNAKNPAAKPVMLAAGQSR